VRVVQAEMLEVARQEAVLVVLLILVIRHSTEVQEGQASLLLLHLLEEVAEQPDRTAQGILVVLQLIHGAVAGMVTTTQAELAVVLKQETVGAVQKLVVLLDKVLVVVVLVQLSVVQRAAVVFQAQAVAEQPLHLVR
jgi:hypothetical protein